MSEADESVESGVPSPADVFDGSESGAAGSAESAARDAASRSTGSGSALRDMLMSTEPNPQLDEIESPWDTENGGPTRILRGFMKVTGSAGVPAVVDIAIGVVETMHQAGMFDDDDGDDSDGGELSPTRAGENFDDGSE